MPVQVHNRAHHHITSLAALHPHACRMAARKVQEKERVKAEKAAKAAARQEQLSALSAEERAAMREVAQVGVVVRCVGWWWCAVGLGGLQGRARREGGGALGRLTACVCVFRAATLWPVHRAQCNAGA